MIEPAGPWTLSVRPPYPTAEVLAFHRTRAIPGITRVDEHGLRWRLDGPGGPVVVAVTAVGDEPRLEVRIDAADGRPIDPIVRDRLIARVRRAFDIDADPAAISAVLARDPVVGPACRAAPGRRLPGTLDPWATLVLAIAAQGVTVASARAVVTRLVDRVSTPTDRPADSSSPDEPWRSFPAPDTVAALDPDELAAAAGLSGRRAATLGAVAGLMARGDLDFDAAAAAGGRTAADAALAALAAIPGIGPWTLGYVALRILHQADAFPVGDAAVRTAFRRRGLASDDRSIAAAAEAWRPWRGYACLHLWATPAPEAVATAPEDRPASPGRSRGR